MKISEYVAELQALLAQHGDLEVEKTIGLNRIEATSPQIAYKKILKGRESSRSFWYPWDGPDRQGDKVVRL